MKGSARPGPSRSGPPFLPLCALIVALSLGACAKSAPDEATLQAAENACRVLLDRWCTAGLDARSDGHHYAIDTTQLLIYAARRGDRALFDRLFSSRGERLLVEAKEDPNAYWVAWRFPADASGTTEALRMAEALFVAAEAFSDPALGQKARGVLLGYERHAAFDQDIWLIRNYRRFDYDLFATNSFLVDYDPDFLREAAAHYSDAGLKDVAERSAALVMAARAPSGLLRQIIQPELKTLMPSDGAIFSPNDVEQLSNSLTVAERSVQSAPLAARKVLEFAADRLPNLGISYQATTGRRLDGRSGGIETFGPFLRLAHGLGRDDLVAETWPRFADLLRGLDQAAPNDRFYLLGEALLTLERLGRPVDRAPQ